MGNIPITHEANIFLWKYIIYVLCDVKNKLFKINMILKGSPFYRSLTLVRNYLGGLCLYPEWTNPALQQSQPVIIPNVSRMKGFRFPTWIPTPEGCIPDRLPWGGCRDYDVRDYDMVRITTWSGLCRSENVYSGNRHGVIFSLNLKLLVFLLVHLKKNVFSIAQFA